MALASISPPAAQLPNQTIQLLERCKTMFELHQIHAQMIKTNLVSHTFSVSKLISCCALSNLPGGLDHALSVFHRIQNSNSFMYFALIKGFSESLNPSESVILYAQMLYTLTVFDGIEVSLPSVLKACGQLQAAHEGQQLHGQVLKTHFKFDTFVLNSLIRMYSELGKIELARQVFDEMANRDVVSWNSMISAYMKVGEIDLACEIFNRMPQKDLVSCNAMIDGYGKCGRPELAAEVFNMMSIKNVVTWTSMICAYVVNGYPEEALDLFRKMLCSGLQPDGPAIVSALSAISDLGFVEEGKWVYAYITTNRTSLNVGFVGSALIDMYSKCGYIENAFTIFGKISHRRNVGDWNSMISGLAIHGLAREAIRIFLELESMDIVPDEITFLGLLKACNHAGLVNEGEFYFNMMQEKYKIVPRIKHYGCMVDLFGRAGHLEDALGIIEIMPMDADVLVWKSILTASLKHGHEMIGEAAALQAMELSPEDSSSYILLSNIYAKAKKWDDVARVRSMMKQRGVKKVPGCTSIVVDGKVHEFFVGKQMGIVLSKMEEVIGRLKLEGYEPDLSQVLLDVEEDGKQSLLSLHTEKSAVAFGLINGSKGAPVRLVQNLRICCDCHCFIKLVSKVYECEIVVRDPNRFHHFKDGSCSCNDYW